MRLATFLTKRVVIGCVCAGTLAAAACTDGRGGGPISPSASSTLADVTPAGPSTQRAAGQAATTSLSARGGEFHLTKECSEYTGQSGSFCTITSSTVKAIEVGSKVVYAQAAGATSVDSDLVIELPGRGNNAVYGHCSLDLTTSIGLCTFSGGTGQFRHFAARAAVSFVSGPTWAWDGTYSFDPRD